MPRAWRRSVQAERRPALCAGGLPSSGQRVPHPYQFLSVHPADPLALQEIQTFTGGRLAGITAKLVVRPEEVGYFDRKEKRKRTAMIWALSLEVDGDDVRKLVANLTEHARLFAETRKLLGSGGKVFEVVED